MTPELHEALNPPRLPADFVQSHPADLLAAFGIGFLVAAALVLLLAPLLRRRVRPASLSERRAALADLPPAERLLGEAKLLAEVGATLPAEFAPALYAGAPHDSARIDSLLRDAWARRGKARETARDG